MTLHNSTESSSGNSSEDPPPPSSLSILVVDDSEMNRRLLERKLKSGPFQRLNWTVDLATSGEETLRICAGGDKGKKYDVIIIDEFMAEGGGTLLGSEVSEMLRQNKENDSVIIVGCTGNCTEKDRQKSIDVGQDIFWEKPIPPSSKALEDISRVWFHKAGRGQSVTKQF